ncbi:hypothetical protein CNEO3_290028 [Clostridium neonatale]|nr:hypothetical protein CNEO3_290028 [Clostridium neonatale]CAI3674636.1 hypothetical protein CNEO3_520002 [Clostridium neonatale]
MKSLDDFFFSLENYIRLVYFIEFAFYIGSHHSHLGDFVYVI